MAISIHSMIGAMSIIAVTTTVPLAVMAEDVPAENATPSLMFSGLGAPAVDELPMEISDDSPLPPLEVTDLGTTVAAADVETTRTDRTIMMNTWSIGVFR